MRSVSLFVLAFAFAAASYGVWLILSKDVQGGRDAAGMIWLAAAAIAALAVGLAVRGRRNGPRSRNQDDD